MVCLSGNIPSYSQFFSFQEPDIINGAVLYFSPDNPILRDCLNEAVELGSRVEWGQVGPLLLTRVAQERGQADRALPSATAYPLHHTEAFEALRPDKTDALRERVRDSQFLHLWNEMLRRERLDKTMLPPAGSLLRMFAERHRVEGWNGEYSSELLEQTLQAEQDLRALRYQLGGLSAEVETLRGESATLHQQIESMSPASLRSLRDENRALREQVERLSSELAIFKDQGSGAAVTRIISGALRVLRRG